MWYCSTSYETSVKETTGENDKGNLNKSCLALLKENCRKRVTALEHT